MKALKLCFFLVAFGVMQAKAQFIVNNVSQPGDAVGTPGNDTVTATLGNFVGSFNGNGGFDTVTVGGTGTISSTNTVLELQNGNVTISNTRTLTKTTDNDYVISFAGTGNNQITNNGTITHGGNFGDSGGGISINGNSVVANNTGTITISGIYGAGIRLAGNNLTATNSGTISATYGIEFFPTGAGSLNNTITGVINSNSGNDSLGVYVGSGTSFNLQNAGTISSDYTGVEINAVATVNNSGFIITTGLNDQGGTSALDLRLGGTVINSGTISSYYVGIRANSSGGSSTTLNITNQFAGTISGFYEEGILFENGGGTVTNLGSISSYYESAIRYTDPSRAGTVINQSSGSIYSDFGDGIRFESNGSVTNRGSISSEYGDGIRFHTPGTFGMVTNEASGSISGYNLNGIMFLGDGNVTNRGSISSYHGDGIRFQTPGTFGTVTNEASGVISSELGNGITMLGDGIVTNRGTISGFHGIRFDSAGTTGTVLNFGSISASTSGYRAIEFAGIGELDNRGTISGSYAVVFQNDGVLINSGEILAFGDPLSGAVYDVGGGGDSFFLSNTGSISAEYAGIFSSSEESVVMNSGSITSSGYGIYMDSLNATLVNSGNILGETVAGVIYGSSGDFSLINTGIIVGNIGIQTINGSGDADVLLRGGVVAGISGTAIHFDGDSGLLTIDARANVQGRMFGDTADDTLVLNLVGMTPQQRQDLADYIDANPNTGIFDVGGYTYEYEDFEEVVFNGISLQQAVDSTLQDLASTLDNLTVPLPDEFDNFYALALENPDAALDLLSGRSFQNALSRVGLNNAQQIGSMVQLRGYEARTGANGISMASLRVRDNSLLASVDQVQSGLASLMASKTMVTDPGAPGYRIPASPAPNREWGAWISGTAQIGDQDEKNNEVGFESKAYGPTIGADYGVAPSFRVGVMVNYTRTDVDMDDGGKIEANTLLPGVYANFAQDNWFANGMVGYGLMGYDNRRTTFGNDAESSPDGDVLVAFLSGGRDFHVEGWVFSPELGFQFTRMTVDGYRETGAGAFNLRVGSQEIESLRSSLGGRIAKSFDTGPVILVPSISGFWIHEFLDDSRGISMSMPGVGDFAIDSRDPDRDYGLLGLGLSGTFKEMQAVTLYMLYQAQVGQGEYFGHNVNAGVRVDF